MAEVLVRAVGATLRFRRRAAVEDLNLQVHRGEVLALLGPNGGGKTTTLMLMAGLIAPTSGEVSVLGLPATQIALHRRGTVGLITAQHGLYPLLTGAENLAFFGGLFGLDRAEVIRRSSGLIEELGMTAFLGERVAGWSSGMRQKLSLVRATLLDPAVLLLDEPTANLDPISAQTIYEAVRRRADAGLAVVLVTHDLRAAEAVCDRAAFVRGSVREVHTMQGPRAAPPTGVLYALYRRLA